MITRLNDVNALRRTDNLTTVSRMYSIRHVLYTIRTHVHIYVYYIGKLRLLLDRSSAILL